MKHPFVLTIMILLAGFVPRVIIGQTSPDSITVIPVDKTTGKITYQEVVMEDGTQNDFFNRAVGWVNQTYKNPTSVTTVRDPETGVIEGNYRFKLYKLTEEQVNMEWGTILYSFKLEFKEGRYRYTFHDFLLKADSRFPIERWLDPTSVDYSEENNQKLKQVDDHMKSLIHSLTLAMQPKPVKQEEPW